MRIFKGATWCETCKKKVIILGGTTLHIESDGTLKLTQGHGKIMGGGR